ncbi:GTPase IMAP family member 4-like [Archocentrus centrarchus]|uniref:GTPase IMAP family member 4-like n=1 Tax=Archocentrus centrarchus TaxID=63155 RepID=UPI0011EA1521|nr:GTPase IMAP family member 4-like [Archocentrus centrarchus]
MEEPQYPKLQRHDTEIPHPATVPHGAKSTPDQQAVERNQARSEPPDDPRIVLFGSDNPKKNLLRAITGKNDTNNKKCQKYSRNINDKNAVIIDTPGLYIYGDDKKKVLEEIKWSVAVAKPGPHVFLLVETIYKEFGKNLEVLEDFQKTFGEQANDFTMMVFTTEKEEEKEKNIQDFRELTYPFNHRYFIFNTEGDEQQQESQVTKLLEKIAEMRREASAHFYTPKMVWEAEKALKQQEEEKQKQEKERRSNVRDRWWLIGAQVGATIGLLIEARKVDSASAGGLGSIVGVILVTLMSYLVLYLKTRIQQSNCKHHENSSESKKKHGVLEDSSI